MIDAPRQLTLEWPHRASFAREDFLVAPENREAFARIESWPNWSSPTMMLIGPKGSGKSHLGAIFAEIADAKVVNGADLHDAAPTDLTNSRALLIDDAHAVGPAEAKLFHVLNLIRENRASALMTASSPPDAWGLKTPDLLSRLRLAPIVELHAPEPDLLRAVLIKLFSDRQLIVDAATVNYLSLHIDRSLQAARNAVDALDREALARGKAITRALAADVLKPKPDQPS